MELLEDEADLAIADLREGVPRHFGDRLPVHDDTAPGRRVETADHVHERRLAGARRTHHGQELAAFDSHRHAVESAYGLVADEVVLVEVFADKHAR